MTHKHCYYTDHSSHTTALSLTGETLNCGDVEVGKYYSNYINGNSGQETESYTDCRQLCRRDGSCSQWSWFYHDADKFAGKCYLGSSSSGPTDSAKAVSGRRNCKFMSFNKDSSLLIVVVKADAVISRLGRSTLTITTTTSGLRRLMVWRAQVSVATSAELWICV